jgi:hypothetical protein
MERIGIVLEFVFSSFFSAPTTRRGCGLRQCAECGGYLPASQTECDSDTCKAAWQAVGF